jgi:hypothetical protein
MNTSQKLVPLFLNQSGYFARCSACFKPSPACAREDDLAVLAAAKAAGWRVGRGHQHQTAHVVTCPECVERRAVTTPVVPAGPRRYRGRRVNHEPIVEVLDAGVVYSFDPAYSLRIRNHSPDGFNWGYAGSGPAQLALAILLDVVADPRFAERHYQDFKREYVAGWGDHWILTVDEVLAWSEAVGRVEAAEGGDE